MPGSADHARRYRLLTEWLGTNSIPLSGLPATYLELRDHLLNAGIIHFHRVSSSTAKPFALGTHFYGPTFEDALDTLPSV